MNSLDKVFPTYFLGEPLRICAWKKFTQHGWIEVLEELNNKNSWDYYLKQIQSLSKISGLSILTLNDTLKSQAPLFVLNFSELFKNKNYLEEILNTDHALPVLSLPSEPIKKMLCTVYLLGLALEYRGPLFIACDENQKGDLPHTPISAAKNTITENWNTKFVYSNTFPKDLP
jgi:hypothetical protein